MTYDDFAAECILLGLKWLPAHDVRVVEMDFGAARAVAITTPDGHWRQAVRGRAHGRWVFPPWWQFWKRPVWLKPLTPQEAIAELASWIIKRDHSCAHLAENEEPLSQ